MASFLLDDLSDLLSSGGITTTIYKGFLAEQPDDAIALIETGGLPAVHAMNASAGNAVEERPTVQIIRRSPVYNRARAEMQFIWRMLDGFGDRNINGTRYMWIASRQMPFTLPEDESRRTMFVCNFDIAKAVSTSTST